MSAGPDRLLKRGITVSALEGEDWIPCNTARTPITPCAGYCQKINAFR
jgi:hypothetical protein